MTDQEALEYLDKLIKGHEVIIYAGKEVGLLYTSNEGLSALKRILELAKRNQKETVTEFADRCKECGARYGKALDKIRAEIEQLNYDIAFINRTRDVADIKHKVYREDVLAIIDKYRKEQT